MDFGLCRKMVVRARVGAALRWRLAAVVTAAGLVGVCGAAAAPVASAAPARSGSRSVASTDPNVTAEAQHVLDVALPVLSEAAGDEVTGSIGDADPWTAIRNAVRLGDYDEIIISTLPLGVSRWLGLDLVSRARDILRMPVTHVQAPKR